MSETPQPVLTLEYASPKGEYPLDPRMRDVAQLSLGTAILSGIAVGSCLLSMALVPVTPILHATVYAALIITAIRCGIAAVSMGMPASVRSADLVALIGLAGIGVAPLVALLVMGGSLHADPGKAAVGSLGVAFTCVAGTAFRSVPFYRQLYAWMAPSSRRLARMLLTLGWFKAVYETIWVGCCALALILAAASEEDSAMVVAFGALFGLLGFIGVWIWMIVIHTLFLKRVKWLLQ